MLRREAPEEENKVQERSFVKRHHNQSPERLWLLFPLTDLNNNRVCQCHLTRVFPNLPSVVNDGHAAAKPLGGGVKKGRGHGQKNKADRRSDGGRLRSYSHDHRR